MKILIALSRFPYPIDKGDKLRAYYQIRHLSRKNDLYIVCLSDSDPSQEDIVHVRQYCRELVLIKHASSKRLTNLCFSIFNSKPFQVNYFSSPEMKSKIRGLIIKKKIDLCYVQLIRLAENIPFGLGCKYYLDYMDAFSEGMKRRYAYSGWYEKPVVSIEAGRLKNYEQYVFDLFDGCSVISRADAESFNEKQKRKLDIIPNGVNEDFFVEVQADKTYDIIFTGNMNYHPNILACKFLVRNILPRLRKIIPGVKICLAGTDPHSDVSALAGPNVVVTGYVKDLRTYLSGSKLFVAPLFSGSGLQNKLLEAMAAGLPVITTSLAAQALKATSGKDLLICDEESQFAEAISLLLADKEKAASIGTAGRRFVKENFSWKHNNEMLEDCFLRLLSIRP
jgi:sugar transferase (PEP-CTERM/EpsH1 system associated)